MPWENQNSHLFKSSGLPYLVQNTFYHISGIIFPCEVMAQWNCLFPNRRLVKLKKNPYQGISETLNQNSMRFLQTACDYPMAKWYAHNYSVRAKICQKSNYDTIYILVTLQEVLDKS